METQVKQFQFPEYITLAGDTLHKEVQDGTVYSLRSSEPYKFSIFKGDSNVFGNTLRIDALKKNVEAHQNAQEKSLFRKMIDKYELIPSYLNSSLHIEVSPSNDHMPGNVYYVNLKDVAKKELYLSTYLKVSEIKKLPAEKYNQLLDAIQFVELEVSPICDWAQKKWKRSRLVSGIIFPAELAIPAFTKENDNLYWNTPALVIENHIKKIVWDCHLLKSLDTTEVQQRPVKLRLRRELLLDIISKISSHVNRPGIAIVE